MNACPTNKISYETATLAARALKNCIELGRNEKHFYLCRHCDNYHLTPQEQTKRKNNIIIKQHTKDGLTVTTFSKGK